jgi:hypothetical protein
VNLRRKNPPDSLYLLLDTLCNAFGGIILLAVLVVLLTSKEKSQSTTSGDAQEMQRRLSVAQTNLQQSLDLAVTLEAKANGGQWKQQLTLLASRKALEEAIQQARETTEASSRELESASSADPTDRLKFLNAAQATAETRKLEAQNQLTASQENIKRLEQKLSNTRVQVTAKVDELQRPLRLPREHFAGRQVVYVVVRYGRIYPCRHQDMSRDETAIHWTVEPEKEIADPIPGKGLDLKAAELYFAGLHKDEIYTVFCVFDDSFSTFIQAKQSVIAMGIAYGWVPFRTADGPVTFSTYGYTPGAQ